MNEFYAFVVSIFPLLRFHWLFSILLMVAAFSGLLGFAKSFNYHKQLFDSKGNNEWLDFKIEQALVRGLFGYAFGVLRVVIGALIFLATINFFVWALF